VGRDWTALSLSSLVAAFITAAVIYTPAMLAVRKAVGGYKPRFCFLLAAAVLGIIPTALVLLVWSGNISLRDLISSESRIFLVMFTVFGIVFGLGYTHGRSATVK